MREVMFISPMGSPQRRRWESVRRMRWRRVEPVLMPVEKRKMGASESGTSEMEGASREESAAMDLVIWATEGVCGVLQVHQAQSSRARREALLPRRVSGLARSWECASGTDTAGVVMFALPRH